MKKIVQKRSLKNKWKKWLGLVCVLGVVITSVVFAMNSSQEKEEVSAHPDNTIAIGSALNNTDFDLPVDAQQLEEDAIRDLAPQFNDYVQGKAQIPVMEKGIVRRYGSTAGPYGPINCSIMDVERTNDNNYFVLFQVHGNASGGIVRTAVYDKHGKQLAVNNYGTKNNANFRINTKIFNKSGNNFLVGVFSNRFFRYTVNESGSNVTIERTLFSTAQVPGTPGTEIGTDYVSIVDQFSGYSNDSLVSGRSHYGNSGSNGTYKKRLSIGSVNTNGWLGSGFNANSVYQCTLQSLLIKEDLGLSENYGTGTGNREASKMFKRNGITFGAIAYATSKGDGGKLNLSTFQMFSDEDIPDTEVSDNGGVRPKIVKKRVYQHRDIPTIHQDTMNGKFYTYEVVKNLCTDDAVYYFADDRETKELIKVDLNTFTDEIIKTYSANTWLNFYPDGKGNFTYYGSTDELSGELHSEYYKNQLSSPYYFISGVMKGISGSADDLDVISLRALEVDGYVSPTFAFAGDNNEIFMAGVTNDRNKFPTYKYMIDETAPDYTVEGGYPSGSSAFIGTLKIKDDYSPVINNNKKSITIDLTNDTIRNVLPTNYMGWSSRDRWLITGSENGTVASPEVIKVYDHFDNNDPVIGATPAAREEWLQKRINRNPRAPTAAIEWEKLGFNDREAGPQLVSYFVTDSQSQPAVTSRWVNATGPQSVKDENDKFAMDAQNFHIPLAGIDSAIPDANKFKELSKTLAWSLTNNGSTSGEHGNGVDEDGASKDASSSQNKLSNKVTVDQTQLKALQGAKVAKPYPVDVTYKADGGPEIVNRVWVFVTTDNTVPNTETCVTPADTKGVVIYADDYMIPYRSRLDQDLDSVLADGKVKAYNYYAKDRTTELAPLPDSTSGQSNWSITDLNVIHDPFSGGAVTLPTTVTPELNYKWSGASDFYHTQGDVTKAKLDVTLTGDVLLNVRQVIQGTNDQLKELIMPTEGYLSIQNTLNNSGTPAVDSTYQSQVTVSSGKKADDPDFTAFGVDIEHLAADADLVDISTIIPSFYKCVGYSISNDKASHASVPVLPDTKISLSRGDIHDKGEYWITIYLEPNGTNDGHPQPYSWDYKKNDLGEIKAQ